MQFERPDQRMCQAFGCAERAGHGVSAPDRGELRAVREQRGDDLSCTPAATGMDDVEVPNDEPAPRGVVLRRIQVPGVRGSEPAVVEAAVESAIPGLVAALLARSPEFAAIWRGHPEP